MSHRIRTLAAVVAAGGSIVAATASVGAGADPKGALTCVAPFDAAAIDRMLADAGSPLAGQGATFVSAAASRGIDPRALVAIAGHETVLLTYRPAAAIHNPFGLGPNMVFDDDAQAITYAANLLAKNYLGEGRRTLDEISGKWAPIGVANDPTNLNANWTGGVGELYRRLGGDPAQPISLDRQGASPCALAPPANPSADTAATPTPTAPAGQPAPGIVSWTGQQPELVGDGMVGGADPATGLPATLPGFVLPIIPGASSLSLSDEFTAPGAPGCYGMAIRCTVTLTGHNGMSVVAAIGGVLVSASAQEQQQGVAFWVVAPDGNRFGYSGLTGYAPGIAHSAAVAPGQLLGSGTATMRFAWDREGHAINAAPLLRATLTR